MRSSSAASVKQTYAVVGPDAVTMVQLLDLIGAALGRARVRKMHVPVGLMRPAARLLHRLPGFPLTPDQLLMLEEDNVGDPQPFATDLRPAPHAAGDRAAGDAQLTQAMPFRHPDRSHDLATRIEFEVRERLEEAIDYVCLEALVRQRRARGLPPPAAENARTIGAHTRRTCWPSCGCSGGS